MTRILVLAAVAALMSACVSTRAHHGYVVELGEEEVTAEIGLDTRESVLARYGEPSVRPALNDNTWYYITMTDNARAFFNTQTTTRTITAVNFQPDGTVAAIEIVELVDGEELALVDRETPTRGKELTFMQQLIGSVGRLPAPGAEGGAPGGP
ncbi:MAG: outer membrane protein assembly factor BamE [Parvularculaceae bacterium]